MENNKEKRYVFLPENEEVTIKDLVGAGAHFGHQIRRKNPKMDRYIFGKKDGINIIDLPKTIFQLNNAKKIVKDFAEKGKKIIFVGVKRQAKEAVKGFAELCGEFHVSERWPGGLLTNMPTVKNSINRLKMLEQKLETGDGLSKKEYSRLRKEMLKLSKTLSGVKEMRHIPDLMVVVDPNNEHIAIAEALKLGVKVICLCDTDCNPDPILKKEGIIIACNDDSRKTISLVLGSSAKIISDVKNSKKSKKEE